MVKFAGEAPISIAFTPDGKALAMGGTNLQMTGFIQLRDLNTRETIWSWTVNPSVKSIAFSPDGKRLASVEGNGLGVLRDATSGEQLALIKGGNVAVLVFGPSGEIAIGTRKGKLAFSRNGNLPPSLPDGAGEAARFAAFSPDGRRIAWARGESVVYMDAAELLKLVWEFKPAGNPQQVAYSPDGKLVAVAHGADVTLLDATTGKAVREFKGGADAKSAMALSPDGRLIAVGNASGNIFLLEMSTGRIVARLSEHTSKVVQLVFSPDGRLLASADDHGMVLTWEKGAKPAASDAGDRLDQLVAQLAKSGRSNDQCIEALFLTMLGRFPQDAEAKRLAERLNKSQDRKETLLDVVWALQNSLEFKAQLEVLQKRRAQLAIP